jgi:MoxR-like ATPase
MNKISNNSILKRHITDSRKRGESDYANLKGVDIAKASRAQLVDWICEFDDPVSIITTFRKHENIVTLGGTEPAPESLSSIPAGDPSVDLAIALQKAMAGSAGTDELVRGELAKLSQRVAELEGSAVKDLHIKIGDSAVIKCGKQHKMFSDLLITCTARKHAWLTGAAGSFKSSAAKRVAEVLELEFSNISVNAQTPKTELMGYMNGHGEYNGTEFRKRYEHGGIFCLDEVDSGNANTLSVLNSALSQDECAFPDGMVNRHKDFILVATANTFGTGASAEYVGRNQLDKATLDRFNTIEWDYDEDLEMDIASDKGWCRDVIAIRNAVNELNIKLIVSPRATFDGQDLLAAGMSYRNVVKGKIFKGLSQDSVDKILSKLPSIAKKFNAK